MARGRFVVKIDIPLGDTEEMKASIRKFSEEAVTLVSARTTAIFGTSDSATPVTIDGYLYPFMNKVARGNLGYGGEMKAALDRVKDWSIAIDGGSQVGRVANMLAEKFGKVYAIELAKENFACLVKNARRNVVPLNRCLTGPGMYGPADYKPDKHPDSPIFHALPRMNGKIQPLAIDELDLPSCGFIKLDLQGYDYFALRGAEHTLRKYKPPLYFEYEWQCYERYGIHKHAHEIFLTELGYEFVGFDDGNQIWA